MSTAQQALVWQRSDFRESSRLVTLITRAQGKLVTLAKGAHREHSPFLGHIDFLNLIEARLGRGGLPLLHRVRLLHEPRGLREPRRYLAASYLCELFDPVFPHGRPDPEVFDLLAGGLRLLERCPPQGIPQVILGVELRLLRALGLLPSLEACARCGSTGQLQPAPLQPALLCSHCSGRIGARPVPRPVLTWLDRAAHCGGRDLPDLPPPPAAAVRLLGRFLPLALERQFRLRTRALASTRPVAAAALSLMLVATMLACTSIDVPLPVNPTAAIKESEALLAQKKPEAALVVLKHYDQEQFAGAERARRTALLGRAYYMAGDSWQAYKEIKSFAQDYPSSPTTEVADVHLKAGLQLLKSDGGFLFFYSDNKRGRQILEDFLVYYHYSPRIPDVLHELAESAFRGEDYELAKERYTQLIQDYKSSEWITLARFRVAMCYFRRLQGPSYDLGEMTRARNELRDFLATPNENPKMNDQARAALAIVQEWLGEKHVRIADFYTTIQNRYGTVYHLRIAAKDFPDTAGGRVAAQRLQRLEHK